MKQSITAALAALSAIFVASADVSAQERMACGPTSEGLSRLAEFNEKMIAVGMFQGAGGLFAQKLSSVGANPQSTGGFFSLYGDKETGSWTALVTMPNGSVSCYIMNGDKLEIQPPYERAPGLPVSLAPSQSDLEKLEYGLIWAKDGGQGLQLKASSPDGDLRLYANTTTGNFTAVLHNPETGEVDILTKGNTFPSLDMVAETVSRMEAEKMAAGIQPPPAPEAAPQ